MKKILFIIIGILIIIGIVYGALIVAKRQTNKGEQIACTMEAKLCPDGSYVGRSGSQCEFAECPSVINEVSKRTTAKLNQKILNNGIYITPLEVIEDSRCPVDVTCIWAGQVRVKVMLQSEGVEKEIILTSDTPITFTKKSIELKSVLPAKDSEIPTGGLAYLFGFAVR